MKETHIMKNNYTIFFVLGVVLGGGVEVGASDSTLLDVQLPLEHENNFIDNVVGTRVRVGDIVFHRVLSRDINGGSRYAYEVPNFVYSPVQERGLNNLGSIYDVVLNTGENIKDIVDVASDTFSHAIDKAKEMGYQVANGDQLFADAIKDYTINLGGEARGFLDYIKDVIKDNYPPIVYDLAVERLGSLFVEGGSKIQVFLKEKMQKNVCCSIVYRLVEGWCKLIKVGYDQGGNNYEIEPKVVYVDD